MARLADWVAGARPRTLPAAVAPVLAGTAVAWFEGGVVPLLASLALVVTVALQVGVNYANDYSDGIRGTDADRVGPMRLVGSGTAEPRRVLAAAIIGFLVAAFAGLGVVVISGYWWLLAVGAVSIAAAWYYTGGRYPYGYLGLGELFVFVFFGLIAVTGTVYIQVGSVSATTWWMAIAIGALACNILVANNLRDLVGDAEVGKRTMATRLGDRYTRWFYLALVAVAVLAVVAVALTTSLWALLGLAMLVPLAPAIRSVMTGATGPALIPVLKLTGVAELVCAVGILVGIWIAH